MQIFVQMCEFNYPLQMVVYVNGRYKNYGIVVCLEMFYQYLEDRKNKN